MTSMMAPLGRLRTQRRSSAFFSFGFSAGWATALGSCTPRTRFVGTCRDRTLAVRPKATTTPDTISLSFSHIIIFKTPSVRSVTAAGDTPVPLDTAARTVD